MARYPLLNMSQIGIFTASVILNNTKIYISNTKISCLYSNNPIGNKDK